MARQAGTEPETLAAQPIASLSAEIIHGDCLEVMRGMADASVDAIICDLPYGTTACRWDSVIPFVPLWEQYKRIAKPNAAIALTASQPFTSSLVMSNPGAFRYELIWDKGRGFEPQLAKVRPQKAHESVCVFYEGRGTFNPQMVERDAPVVKSGNYSNSGLGILSGSGRITKTYTHRYPTSVLRFSNSNQAAKEHPTQKPVALMEYLVRTYTNAGDVVLDNACGSGTTGVACVNTARRFIGIEREATYVEIARRRIADAQAQLGLGVA